MKPRKRVKRSLRRRLLPLFVVIFVTIIAAGFLYWYTSKTNAEIAQIEQASAANTSDMDAKIAKIKADKIAKAKADAAKAKAAAKKAQTGSSASINSKDCNTATTHINPASIDVLVNKKHCMQPLSYAPKDLVDMGGGFLLSKKAASSFNAMRSAAAKAGQSISITSSYRSYATQITTYNYWVGISGKAGADTYSARPGYSEHQTGFAVDVEAPGCSLNCFGKTSQYTWLQKNAAKYGFIQRYYKGYDSITGYTAEEWHYRYVGVTVALDMKAKGIKTLEQYWGLPGGNY